MRMWLDGRQIVLTGFRSRPDMSFELSFRSEGDARLFEAEFGDA